MSDCKAVYNEKQLMLLLVHGVVRILSVEQNQMVVTRLAGGNLHWTIMHMS